MGELEERKTKCPDCHFCQECGKNRCRLCRRGEGCENDPSGLGTGFTYGEYLAWKNKKSECEKPQSSI